MLLAVSVRFCEIYQVKIVSTYILHQICVCAHMRSYLDQFLYSFAILPPDAYSNTHGSPRMPKL